MFEFTFTWRCVVSKYRVDVETYKVIAKDLDEAKQLVKDRHCWLGHWGYWRKKSGSSEIHRLDRIGEMITLHHAGRRLQ